MADFKKKDKVVLKSFEECVRLGMERNSIDKNYQFEKGKALYTDLEWFEKNKCENNFIGEITNHYERIAYRIQPGNMWLYDFMFDHKNKYVIKIEL